MFDKKEEVEEVPWEGTKWEYRVEIFLTLGKKSMGKDLTKLGEQGWEVTGSFLDDGLVRVIMKRQTN